MLQPMLLVFNFLCIIITVNSHSLLRVPTSWSTRESKRAPCGNGNLPGTAPTGTGNANVVPSSTVTGSWAVTAGDGNGPVTATYVTTDAAVTANGFNAGANLAIAMNPTPQSGTGTYPFTFPAPPAGACKGGANGATCYIQFKSTSNWYSCMSMSMLEAPVPTPAPQVAVTNSPTDSPTDPPPASVCEAFPSKNPASICQGLVGRNVLRPTAATFDDKITEADNSFNANRFKLLVFRNGATRECGNALATYFCADLIPACTPGSLTPRYLCKTRCEEAISACDVDPYHYSAFSCDIYDNVESDAYGTCPATSTARTVHLKSRYVGPTDVGGWNANTKYLDMILYVGDKLTFKWTGTDYVKKFNSEAAFESCSFGDSEDVLETTAGTIEWVTPAPGEYFFGGTGCLPDADAQAMTKNQKVKVVVVATPAGATIVPLSAGEPETILAAPPTGSPGGFVPDLYPDESGSVRVNAMTFVLFSSALLNFVW